MERLSAECVTMIATSIAVELAKDKSLEDVIIIKNITNQITQSLNTIIFQRSAEKKSSK